jgi:bifunctional non-homologous end joining protein LigD
MALEEYQRKRRFTHTPEPPAQVRHAAGHRFVVQKHRASHLHYDFRLEMEGVLKSWAVPKGPSLDPADKRLAMMVEDHPVSYIDFEGVIPPGNYGAGTVMVWDLGNWEPIWPEGVAQPRTAAERDAATAAMLAKGDLKFGLHGKKLKGSFVLAHIRSRRPGSKGNEWLLIKHRDAEADPGYNIDKYDYSALTGRTLAEIGADADSAEWQSNRPAAISKRNSWLAKSIARHDRAEAALEAKAKRPAKTVLKATRAKPSQWEKKAAAKRSTTAAASNRRGSMAAGNSDASAAKPGKRAPQQTPRLPSQERTRTTANKRTAPRVLDVAGDSGGGSGSQILGSRRPASRTPASTKALEALAGARRAPMPASLRPMLATLVDEPFNDSAWLYEIKWDGYRALAFLDEGGERLVSRNQNLLTQQFPELADIASAIKARQAIVDGEVCALDEQGRPSFSLMQQRTGGLGHGLQVGHGSHGIPIVYYAFDLIYLDGFDLRRVALEQRKQQLRRVLVANDLVRYSEHFDDGVALYEAARQRGLEGIVAKRRNSCYLEKRSREWLKMKITMRQECVIGGYTDPRGTREHFGSVVLGLYDDQGRLVHVGQAGSGFTQATHEDMWRRLQAIRQERSPFYGPVEATRRVHWVRPELVVEIKFTEWTHEGQSGGVKMRAPVFEGLRFDKPPRECVFERPRSPQQAQHRRLMGTPRPVRDVATHPDRAA